MGSEFGIIFFDHDSLHAQSLARNAFLIVDSLNNSFSDYDETSEISILTKNYGNFVAVSDHLFEIIVESKKAFEKSQGYFDITIGQLTKLWRKAKRERKLAHKKDLDFAKDHSGFQYLKINLPQKEVKIEKKGILIDLGGIGKGYAAQKVLEYLQSQKIENALINASGNMAFTGKPIGKEHWEIAIEIPNQNYFLEDKMIYLNNDAVSTSGDAYQNIVINGVKYSHILNPKTGLGLSNQKQVTIICKNAAKADWLSTACCILPTKKALNLANSEHAGILIVENKKGKLSFTSNQIFTHYTKKSIN
jgi:FAD:protein FMN transferase